jgi:hypothetical protein
LLASFLLHRAFPRKPSSSSAFPYFPPL